jgi:hypothetical protein
LAAQRRLFEMTGNTPYARYLGKHSPLVSDQALIARATTGLDPWEGIVKTYQKGQKAGQPILYDSTRFNNYQDMLELKFGNEIWCNEIWCHPYFVEIGVGV